MKNRERQGKKSREKMREGGDGEKRESEPAVRKARHDGEQNKERL